MPEDYDIPGWVSERRPPGDADALTDAGAGPAADPLTRRGVRAARERAGADGPGEVDRASGAAVGAASRRPGDRGRHRPGSAQRRGPSRRVRLHRTFAATAAVLLLGTGSMYVRAHEASGAAPTAQVSPEPSHATEASADTTPSPSQTPTHTPTPTPSPTAKPTVVVRGSGSFTTVALPRLSNTAAPSGARILRIAFQIEGGLGIDPAPVAQKIAVTLLDKRGWEPKDHLRFRFVTAAEARSGAVDITIRLASPDTTDALCAPLATNGFTSCFANHRAVLNARRWLDGVTFYAGHLGLYRTYMVNHEVGHGLGHGHEHCPAAGDKAPTMQQQTLRMEGCVINPYPMVA